MSRLVEVQARKLQWTFAGTRRHWWGGRAARTHLLNAYTLLVPDNEKYYIRTLAACVEQIQDHRLRGDVHAFLRQESLHGIAHQKYWHTLAAHGIDGSAFVKAADWLLYRLAEPLQPRRLRVSIVAAIEHLNAVWAHAFLARDLLRDADPELRRLFYWHFAEEIEHKAVAHDVLAALYPGYLSRLAGALIAIPTFYLLMLSGLVHLLWRDRAAWGGHWLRDLGALLFRQRFLGDNLREVWRYLRPGFTPWALDDYALARAALREHAAAKSATTGPDAAATPRDVARA